MHKKVENNYAIPGDEDSLPNIPYRFIKIITLETGHYLSYNHIASLFIEVKE